MATDAAANLAITTLTGIAVLVLVSLGLAVIFGVMGIINLAHGEFIMLGGFTVLVLVRRHMPVLAAVVVAPLAVGLIAFLIERGVIRFLYGRLIDTMLATWGLSLVIVQVMTKIFGSTTRGFAAPLGSFTVGRYRVSEYSLVLIVSAVLLLAGAYLLFTRTRYGMLARAVAHDATIAEALGVSSARVRSVTFVIGGALAGVAGGLLASVVPVVPTMGQAFVVRSFMTVIVGGPAVVSGTAASASVLGTTQGLAANWWNATIGQVALLVTAIVLLRIWPQGLSARWRRQL